MTFTRDIEEKKVPVTAPPKSRHAVIIAFRMARRRHNALVRVGNQSWRRPLLRPPRRRAQCAVGSRALAAVDAATT